MDRARIVRNSWYTRASGRQIYLKETDVLDTGMGE